MLNERKAIAVLLADFRKGKKISDPMLYAESAKFLMDRYGSAKQVAEKLGLGKEVVRVLAKLTELPVEVRNLISRGDLLLTVAFDLVPLDPTRQLEVARAVCGLTHRDAREVIRQAARNPSRSAQEIRREVLSELEKKEVNIVMVGFTREIHKLLSQESADIPQLVTSIIQDWLEKKYPISTEATKQGMDLAPLIVRLPRPTFKALRKLSKKPANLVERIVISWLQRKEKNHMTS